MVLCVTFLSKQRPSCLNCTITHTVYSAMYTSIKPNIYLASLTPKLSHLSFDHLQYAKMKSPFYHMNGISVYQGRQRRGGVLCKTVLSYEGQHCQYCLVHVLSYVRQYTVYYQPSRQSPHARAHTPGPTHPSLTHQYLTQPQNVLELSALYGSLVIQM